MGKGEYAQKPLLYIQQPKINAPVAEMQHHYHSAKNKTPKVEADPVKPISVQKRHLNRRNSFSVPEIREVAEIDLGIEVAEVNAEMDQMKVDIEVDSVVEDEVNRNNSFKEKSLRERVDYFINLTSNMPAMKCEVKTVNDLYRGIIRDFKDGFVFIELGRAGITEKVVFDKIQTIRMLGF